ncbi:Aspartic endopeptidase [Sarracenia purpurea var. burkii]
MENPVSAEPKQDHQELKFPNYRVIMAIPVKNFHSLFFSAILISISIFIFIFPAFSVAESTRSYRTIGFSVDLIHRDSPASPFYDSSLTPSERLSNALKRSHSRLNYFKRCSSMAASSEIIPGGGAYLMTISIGSPPVPIHAVADTGSDLIWTQCTPCTDCYKQNAPLFNPHKSSTFKVVSCRSDQCEILPSTSCLGNSSCSYSVLYGDQSFSEGVLATETVTLGSTHGGLVSIPSTTFGCGFNNAGTFSANGSGIVGLGGGRLSLISQLKSLIAGKFSYCLIPTSSQNSKAGQMHFGTDAVVSGRGVVSTPITSKSPATFYFLTLNAITVGTKRLVLPTSSSSSSSSSSATSINTTGNIIIDSGTTLTYLPSDLYNKLVPAVQSAIGLAPVEDPLGQLDLCYNNSDSLSIPDFTAHFAGADVKLNPVNTFVATSDDVVCLAFAAAGDIAIFGNVAQLNKSVAYDLEKKTVSFKATDCASE